MDHEEMTHTEVVASVIAGLLTERDDVAIDGPIVVDGVAYLRATIDGEKFQVIVRSEP